MSIKRIVVVGVLGIGVFGGLTTSLFFIGKMVAEGIKEVRRTHTTIPSSVGTHHNIKCIDGVNYLTKVGTVKIDPDTLLPETCK